MALKNATAAAAGVATTSAACHRFKKIALVVAGIASVTTSAKRTKGMAVAPHGVATATAARPRVKRVITAAAHGSGTATVDLNAAPFAVLDSTHFDVSCRVWIADGDDVLRNYTSQGGFNLIDQVEVDFDIDQPVSQATIQLRRDVIDGSGSVKSLSPLRSDSTLNRNAATAFSPAIDAGRRVKIEVATVASGLSVGAANWQNIFEGTLDAWDVAQSPINLTARDAGGVLVDRFIETPTSYSSDPGIAMETVMQSILDDWVGGVTLYCPVSPNYDIKPYQQTSQSIMDALQALSGLIGWDIRYLYDRGSNSWRLTLLEPPRTKTAPDRTVSASRIFSVETLAVARTDVRNAIDISYLDSATGTRLVESVEDATSIASFGRQWMGDVEPDDSPIDSSTEAAALGAIILSDTKDPKANQSVVEHLDWTVELNQLRRYTANGIHYDTNQDLAVVGYKHLISATQHRTTIQVRGNPCGRYLGWRKRASIPATVIATPSLVNFRLYSEDDTTIVYAWTKGENTSEVWAAQEIFTSPVPSDPWATVAASVVPLSVDTFTVTKPDAGSFTYVQIEPRDASLVPGDVQRLIVSPGQAPLEYGASPQGTVSIDTNGSWSASLDGPQQALSYKWLSSTSAYPTDADVKSSGTLVNGRTFHITAGGTLDFGETIFITVVPYPAVSAGGDAGVSAHLRGSYQSYTPTKTVAYSATNFLPVQAWLTIYGAYFGPSVQAVIALPVDYVAQCIAIIPPGSVITQASQEVYYNDTGGINAYVSAVSIGFYRVDSSSSTTGLGSASATNLLGWQTLSIPLSETSTGKAYAITIDFTLTAHGTSFLHDVTSAFGGTFFLTYAMTDPTTTI